MCVCVCISSGIQTMIPHISIIVFSSPWLPWCRPARPGGPAARPGERIVAVDQAPELPESIKHLVQHAAWSPQPGVPGGEVGVGTRAKPWKIIRMDGLSWKSP